MVLTKKETEASNFLTNLFKLQNFYRCLNVLESFNESDILSDLTITREDIWSNKHVASFDEFLNQINGKADSLDHASEIVLSNLSVDLRQYIRDDDVRFCLSTDRLVCNMKDEEDTVRTMDLVEQNMARLDDMHKKYNAHLMENIGDEVVVNREDIVGYFYESYEDYIASSFAVSLAQRKKYELNLIDVLQEETYHQYNDFLDKEYKSMDCFMDYMYVYAFELFHDREEVNDLFEPLLEETEKHIDLYLAMNELNEQSNEVIQQTLEPIQADAPFDFNEALKKAEKRYYDGEVQGKVPYYADYLAAKEVRLSSAKQDDCDLDM